MARSESRTKTAIWADVDFRLLSGSMQRTYWMLYSQPTISLCGVQALTVKRWAQYSSDGTVEALLADLAALEDAGYITCDMDTEEVFVRSFARHDGIHKNSKTWPAAWRQLDSISSTRIRDFAEAELWKMGHPPDEIKTSMGHPPVDNHNPDAPCDTPSDTPYDLSPPVPRLQSPPPSSSPPGSKPAGTGATHRDGWGLRVRRDLAESVANVCVGKNRRSVATEAVELVEWALAAVDRRVVDEAIGWAKAQEEPPVLPRALASTIVKKARDSNIALLAFKPRKSA